MKQASKANVASEWSERCEQTNIARDRVARLKRDCHMKNSRKSVRWSAVPIAPKLVYVRCEGERGSGPEGADDLCCFYLGLKDGIRAWRLELGH